MCQEEREAGPRQERREEGNKVSCETLETGGQTGSQDFVEVWRMRAFCEFTDWVVEGGMALGARDQASANGTNVVPPSIVSGVGAELPRCVFFLTWFLRLC